MSKSRQWAMGKDVPAALASACSKLLRAEDVTTELLTDPVNGAESRCPSVALPLWAASPYPASAAARSISAALPQKPRAGFCPHRQEKLKGATSPSKSSLQRPESHRRAAPGHRWLEPELAGARTEAKKKTRLVWVGNHIFFLNLGLFQSEPLAAGQLARPRP